MSRKSNVSALGRPSTPYWHIQQAAHLASFKLVQPADMHDLCRLSQDYMLRFYSDKFLEIGLDRLCWQASESQDLKEAVGYLFYILNQDVT